MTERRHAHAALSRPLLPPLLRPAELVLPLATLLGLAERPGESHGLGPLDPELCRQLAATAIASPLTRLCVTVTDPGTKDEETSTPVFVALQGADSAGLPLRWSAKGLPAGLSMGRRSGRITGTLTSSAKLHWYFSLSSDRPGSRVSSPRQPSPLMTECTTTSAPVSVSMPAASQPRIIGNRSALMPTPRSVHRS